VTSTLETQDGIARQLRVRVNDGDRWRLAAGQATLVVQPASK